MLVAAEDEVVAAPRVVRVVMAATQGRKIAATARRSAEAEEVVAEMAEMAEMAQMAVMGAEDHRSGLLYSARDHLIRFLQV